MKNLSVQERKIYTLLKEGKSNKEISEELNIGLSTVKSHASNIYSKLKIFFFSLAKLSVQTKQVNPSPAFATRGGHDLKFVN